MFLPLPNGMRGWEGRGEWAIGGGTENTPAAARPAPQPVPGRQPQCGEGARARPPPAGRRGWGRASRRRPSSAQARARIPLLPGSPDGRALPRRVRGPPPLPPCAPPPPAAAARRTHLQAARSVLAGWELVRRRRGRALDPPPTPGREPCRFAGAAPGLAPCRPLIGAPGRPLGREARRPSATLGAHGRQGERRREGRRPSTREEPRRETVSETREPLPPHLLSLRPAPQPDRRRTRPISVRGARGVSRASGASNRKGDVAR